MDSSYINHQTPGLGKSALGEAALGGNPSSIKLLLEAKADTDVRRTNGQTPMMEAALHGHCECTRLLLAAGSHTEARDPNFGNVLDMPDAF
eukprot:7384099-Prymnesium_polylepis.1